MSSNRRWTIALLLFTFLLLPRESDAFWRWLHELSGPGPFTGYGVILRCAVPAGNDPTPATEDDDSEDTGRLSKTVSCLQPFGFRDTDDQLWITGSLWWLSEREQSRIGEPLVDLFSGSLGFDTTAHSTFVGVPPDSRIRLLAGADVAGNRFSGDGFDTFTERSVTIAPFGITVRPHRAVTLDATVNWTYINVAPDQFGLPPDAFPGGGEWLRGFALSFSIDPTNIY